MDIETATTEHLIAALARLKQVAESYTNNNLREGENAKKMVRLIGRELKIRSIDGDPK